MPQKIRQIILFLCAIAALYSVSGASAQDVPPYLVHQGRLLDALNAPVEGAQSLTFNLYAEETGGSSLWTETQTVSVNAGFYSVTLGQVAPLMVSAFNGDTLYLGVTIGGEELAPRLAMRSVPYALKAGAAQNAVGDLTPTSVTIGDVVIDASGVTIGGANVIDGSGQWSGPAPTVSFNDLLDPPTTLSSLACGDGEVAQVVGGAWACVPASSADTLSGLACANGQVAKRVGGAWACADDTDTTYTAGNGISLTAGAFSADATVQRRTIAPACPAGQYLRTIAADGTPTCAIDTDTTYTAGSGISLTGGAFSTDATVQRRTATPTCPAGQYLRAIAADGTPTCAVDIDTDTNTTYSAAPGSGVTLVGGAFGTDATIQRRTATPTCPAGQYLRAIAADGTPTCAIDVDTNTTYSAAPGSGVTLVGGAFGTDATIQRRTATPTCPAGQYLRAIAADGTPTCAPDVDTTLNEAQVDAFVANNGYAAAADIATTILQVDDARIRYTPNSFTCNPGEWCNAVNAWGINRFSTNSRFTNCTGEADCSGAAIDLVLTANTARSVLMSHLDWSNTGILTVYLSFDGGTTFSFHKAIQTQRRVAQTPYTSTIRVLATNLPQGSDVVVRVVPSKGRMHFEGFGLSRQILPEETQSAFRNVVGISGKQNDTTCDVNSACFAPLAARQFTFVKTQTQSRVRIDYTDNMRSYGGDGVTRACRWFVRFNGVECPSGDIYGDVYAEGGAGNNYHHMRNISGYCDSLPAGTYTVQVYAGNVPGYQARCWTGWTDSTFFLEAEELQ
jgi:hypothetical protein